MKKTYLILFVLLCAVTTSVDAQCAMCRAVLETAEGQGTAEGINDGIVYLMSIPYILVGGIFYVFYLKFFRTKK